MSSTTPNTFVVRVAGGKKYLIDNGQRREIRSGLLAAAVEAGFGESRPVEEAELEQWSKTAPVEVMQSPTGPPFIIAGGQRLAVRGLPVPYPVDPEQARAFPEGPALDVAKANVPRAMWVRAARGRPATVGEVFRTAGRVVKRGLRKLKPGSNRS